MKYSKSNIENKLYKLIFKKWNVENEKENEKKKTK